MKNDPRKNALQVLSDLTNGKRTLDYLLNNLDEDAVNMSKRDRALMQALVYGVLRWQRKLDSIISKFSKTKLDKIDPKILNVLRVGLYQIIFLDKIPSAAAVNTSVELAKSYGAPWTVRFVNGLLRNIVRQNKGTFDPDKPVSSIDALSTEKSFPPWLLQRWIDKIGFEETAALCDEMNSVPPLTVRVNTLKTSRKHAFAELEKYAEQVCETPFSPEGISFFRPKIPIHQIPFFQEGHFTVQDEAAQLVSHLLSPKPGEIILDACAGLGGKTSHMAQLMKNSGQIFALDRDNRKLSLLEADMMRLGISIVSSQIHSIGTAHFNFPPCSFNRILLDAPCSGTGVIRRNPDIKWALHPSDFVRLSKQQLQLLSAVAELVAVNGILLYVVCSIEPEENQEVIRRFLACNTNFHILPVKNGESVPASAITGEGFLATLPHRDAMDGFFMARLCRHSE